MEQIPRVDTRNANRFDETTLFAPWASIAGVLLARGGGGPGRLLAQMPLLPGLVLSTSCCGGSGPSLFAGQGSVVEHQRTAQNRTNTNDSTDSTLN